MSKAQTQKKRKDRRKEGRKEGTGEKRKEKLTKIYKLKMYNVCKYAKTIIVIDFINNLKKKVIFFSSPSNLCKALLHGLFNYQYCLQMFDYILILCNYYLIEY